ncbi:hypothetical protein B0H14DRAFT_2831088 [Mycena olivaceomarginata]|nr:hypothetical protein B0H14DRAFT_2831088 [Mycena olivaceomarginata]
MAGLGVFATRLLYAARAFTRVLLLILFSSLAYCELTLLKQPEIESVQYSLMAAHKYSEFKTGLDIRGSAGTAVDFDI